MNFQDYMSGVSQAHLGNQASGERGTAAGMAENQAMRQAMALQELQRAEAYRQEVNARNQGAQLPGDVDLGDGQFYQSAPYIAPPAVPMAPAPRGLAMPSRGMAPPATTPAPVDYGPAIARYQRAIAAGFPAGAQPSQIESDRRTLAGAVMQPNSAALDVMTLPARGIGMIGEKGLNLIGRGVNAVTGKPTMPTDFSRITDAGMTPFYDKYGRQYEAPPEDPRIADYRSAVAKLQALQAAQSKPATGPAGGAPAPTAQAPAPMARPTPAMAMTAPVGAAPAQAQAPTQPDSQSFAANAGELANRQNLRMVDMQLNQIQGMMDAATKTGNPQQFQEAQAHGMKLLQQRNVLVGKQAIVDLALGGDSANAALKTLNQTFGRDFRVKARTDAGGNKQIDVFHGSAPIPGMQNLTLQQFQSALLAKVDPDYAQQVVDAGVKGNENQLKYGDKNRIDAAKVQADVYIAKMGLEEKRLAAQLLANGFKITPDQQGGAYYANANEAFTITPEVPPSKANPTGTPAKMVRIQKPATNTGVPGQGGAVYKNGAWVTQ